MGRRDARATFEVPPAAKKNVEEAPDRKVQSVSVLAAVAKMHDARDDRDAEKSRY